MQKKKDELLKLEIAKELGLLEKIQQGGWKSLTSKETGRIGGLLSRKRKSKIV
ncbi:MAG: small, acid-soluble spore protein, alpha/beta type [Clostridiaceae bacterium]|nr:small, acid-soluble spore protein, alpha/beta type [Clostridiaceae bacterium]